MRLIDIINAPWAITPEMLSEIQAIYGRHLRGDKIDLAELSATTGISFDNKAKSYSVEKGVAVLPVDGVIAKRMNLFSKISGGMSSELIGRDFTAALNSPDVSAIVLAVDSPGGTVDGSPELADIIYRARGRKPVLACTDGMMCSAAYWIGSAADLINISSEVAITGSIGIVGQHVDVSVAEEKTGRKTTEIFAGKYKRIASQYGPLTAEGRAYLQASVDHAYSVFVDDVARNRGASVDDVLTRMADGRTFNGSQAIDAGLVDGVATLAETIEQAREMARRPTSKQWAGVARANQEDNMDLKTLKEQHPDLVAAIITEAMAGVDVKIAEARDAGLIAGSQAERERIASVRAQALPGHEALIEQLAFDGASTGDDAAKAIIAAERQLRDQAGAARDQEANPLVPGAVVGDKVASVKRSEFDAMSSDQRRAHMAAGGRVVD